MEEGVHLMFSMSFLEFFGIKSCAKTNYLIPMLKETEQAFLQTKA